MSIDDVERPSRARRLALGAAFLLVGLGLGSGTALAATGAAALLVRDAPASAATDISRSEPIVFPLPAPASDDVTRAAGHEEVVDRPPSAALQRAESAAEAEARARPRPRGKAFAVPSVRAE